jgi:UDP:flavonoid glycosyltransferase YjiC (YdhE family)
VGGVVNHFSHQLTRQMIWQGGRAADQAARAQVLGLPPASFWGAYGAAKFRALPILYGFSSAVIPRPSDWEARITVTGYWFLEGAANWTPPADLVAFLEAGAKPLYIGFGSMTSQDPEATTRLTLQALEQTNQRAVLLSGWGGLSQRDLPPSVYMIEAIPHAWLFPRVAAVIHHGGAGTTAAGLRAGVPTIITPFFGDQGFWGQRVAQLGVGTAPIPHKHLTAEHLAAAIRTVTRNTEMQRRAAALGATIRAEDGIEQAVAIINRLS